jgi:hypothetical protein
LRIGLWQPNVGLLFHPTGANGNKEIGLGAFFWNPDIFVEQVIEFNPIVR